MFNPLYPFTKDVFEAIIKTGCNYFVRNTYPNGMDILYEEIKGSFLFTHYNEKNKAEAHYNSIAGDKNRYLYAYENLTDREKLEIAASQPKGYKVYSSYFMPNYKDKISKRLKEKINNYIFRFTKWRPEKGDIVNVDFYLQFGVLYITLSYSGQQIKVNLEEIEKLK